MKYHDGRKLLHKTDALGVGLDVALLQVRDDMSCGYDEVLGSAMSWPIGFASRQVVRILHMLEKFHHYYFACQVHVIMGHRPFIVIMGKDLVIPSHHLQCKLLCIHQYRVCIL